jgi:large subunit ribosomal protein L15
MSSEKPHGRVSLSSLRPPKGSTHAPKRLGRGPGSGHGKTAGKGHKGQKARSGGHVRPGFEGGQMPLIRRVPKRGFTNPFKVRWQIVSLEKLGAFAGREVTVAALAEAGIVDRTDVGVKLLADGDAPQGLVVRGVALSASARRKIEAAGGRVEE